MRTSETRQREEGKGQSRKSAGRSSNNVNLEAFALKYVPIALIFFKCFLCSLLTGLRVLPKLDAPAGASRSNIATQRHRPISHAVAVAYSRFSAITCDSNRGCSFLSTDDRSSNN